MTLLDRTINIKTYKSNTPDMSLMSVLAMYYILFIFVHGVSTVNVLNPLALIIKFMMLAVLLIILGCYNTFDIMRYGAILLVLVVAIDLLPMAFAIIVILLLFCELLFDAGMLYGEQSVYQDETFEKVNIKGYKQGNKKTKRFLTFTIVLVIIVGLGTKLVTKKDEI